MNTFVDTHCHIDRYRDPVGVLAAASAANVVTIAVTELPSSFQRLALRLGKKSGVRVALGFHPMKAGAATPLELALFARSLDRVDYIGEIGLDGSREGRVTLRAQVKLLERLLSQPRIRTKVLTVHSRGAEQETIQHLAEARVTAILHWYSGALKHIDTAVDAGLWFSVNSAMLRSERGQRVVNALPRERVVTETDGPYTRIGGEPAQPKDIPAVVLGLSRTWHEEPEQARQRIFDNMARIARSAREHPGAAC